MYWYTNPACSMQGAKRSIYCYTVFPPSSAEGTESHAHRWKVVFNLRGRFCTCCPGTGFIYFLAYNEPPPPVVAEGRSPCSVSCSLAYMIAYERRLDLPSKWKKITTWLVCGVCEKGKGCCALALALLFQLGVRGVWLLEF